MVRNNPLDMSAAMCGRSLQGFGPALVFALCSAAASARSETAEHPLAPRFDGASILYASTVEFDEALLLTDKLDRNARKAAGVAGWMSVEGKVSKWRYELPAGRSSLEAFRQRQAGLLAKGFEPLFACVDLACMTSDAREPDIHMIGAFVDSDNRNPIIYYDRARYALFRLSEPRREVHVAVLVGEREQRTSEFVELVEKRAAESPAVAPPTPPTPPPTPPTPALVPPAPAAPAPENSAEATKPPVPATAPAPSADEMRAGLARHGAFDLHSILFDYAADTLRPEAGASIAEIARLLRESPDLKLKVIGHTDDRGGAAYNRDLSRRRAAAVARALVAEHGVAPERLSSSGEGFDRPVASNATEEGRAANRRVELARE